MSALPSPERSAELHRDTPIGVIDGARLPRATSAAGDSSVQSGMHDGSDDVIHSSLSCGSRGNGVWIAVDKLYIAAAAPMPMARVTPIETLYAGLRGNARVPCRRSCVRGS